MAKNIENKALGQLDWSEKSRVKSLTEVFEYAIGVSREAQDWYEGKHPSKRSSGRALRLTGLLFLGVGGVLPIISEISSSASGKPAIAPGWAAVALALAAGCGILDRYLGYSSAWMRFILAEQRLESQRQDFASEDLADPQLLNRIIWFSVRGSNKSYPTVARMPAFDVMRTVSDEESAEQLDINRLMKTFLARRSPKSRESSADRD